MKALLAALLILNSYSSRAADDEAHIFTLVDRFEYANNDNQLTLDMRAWWGNDTHALLFESEVERAEGEIEDGDVRLLYRRPFSRFFDWKLGAGHQFEPGPDRAFVIFGVEGLAPYWLEVDADIRLSEQGDISATFEVETDWLIAQRIVLQPRIEIRLQAQNVPEHLVGSGLSSVEAGLRLRYEITRKLAPYVGISWHRSYGNTGDLVSNQDEDRDDLSAVLGVRFWF